MLDTKSLINLEKECKEWIVYYKAEREKSSQEGDNIATAYNSGIIKGFSHALGVLASIMEDQEQRERVGA